MSCSLPEHWLPTGQGVLPAYPGEGISAEVCVVAENSKGDTVFNEI